MRYRILGPLELMDDAGRPVPLGGSRERVLLATLLLGANRVVSRDRLIDALWGDRPPGSAANALQVHVSKLRRTLAPAPDTPGPLHTQSPGYLLRTLPGELDAERFEELATESRPGDGPAETSARLAEALALWAGPVLDGLESDGSWRSDATRLEELRASVLERRIEADLALGRHRELVGELEALVLAHPLREELRGQLMLALYRSGRQADALGVYRSTRQVLAEEFGIDPNPVLQALELAILHQSPELDLTAGATRGPVAGARPLPSPGSDGTIPLPGRLAARPDVGVVGRTAELEDIADAYKRVLADGDRELLLVSGEAGLGKTTLVAEAARAAFDDGACVLFGHCEEDLATPVPVLCRSPRALQPPRHRGAALDPRRRPRVRAGPARPRTARPSTGSAGVEGDRRRHRAVPPLRRRGGHAGHDRRSTSPSSSSSTTSSGPTRGASLCSAISWPPSRSDGCSSSPPTGTASWPTPTPCGTPWAALRRHSGVSRIELVGLDDGAVVVLPGGGRRSDPRRCRRRPRPRRLPRDRRESVLRGGGAAPSLGDRGHPPGCHRPVGGRGVPRTRGPARQRPRGHRWPGRAPGKGRRTRPVPGRGDRPGLRSRRAGPGHEDHRGRAARHPRCRRRRRRWSGS